MSSYNGPIAFDNLIKRYQSMADGYPCHKVTILRAMREMSIEPNYWKLFNRSVYLEMQLAATRDLEEEQQLLIEMVKKEKESK
jgi:hypothetical protein